MKWRRTFLLALLLLAGFAAGAVAASQVEKVTAYIRHDFQVLLNGKKADVGNILLMDGTSYLPLRSLGQLLGAEVAFDASTNSIHVTRKTAGPQVDPDDYDTTSLVMANGYTITVDDREFPVFSFVDTHFKTYYRVRDLERAGIDTSGARKTKEAVTKQFFVSETELKRVADPYPKFKLYGYRMVIGENEPDRLVAIDKFIEDSLRFYVDPANTYAYVPPPTILLIETETENEYEILAMENQEFKKYIVKTKKNDRDGSWVISYFKREHLGSLDDYMGYYSF